MENHGFVRVMHHALIVAVLTAILSPPRLAMPQGSVFLTGHDADVHAQVMTPPEDGIAAQHIIQVAIQCMTDRNSFYPSASKFLYVESTDTLAGGHSYGEVGIAASGFVSGTDYEAHTAATLAGELALLGTKYYALVVASDFGGMLTQDELNVLNAHSTGIINFLNAGGGVVVFPEGSGGSHLTTSGQYGFLPEVPTSLGCNGDEAGITLTPYGSQLGLLPTDVNTNAYHACFATTYGLKVVDQDANGNIVTLHDRKLFDCPGIPPPDDMVGWWPFDEPAEPVAHDVKSGNDGAYEGSLLPQPVAGVVINGLRFDNQGEPRSYVSVADDPLLRPGTDDFTIDAWVRPEYMVGTVFPLVAKGANYWTPTDYPDDVGYEWGITVLGGKSQYLVLSNGRISSSFHYCPGVALWDGNWHHLAVTVNRSSGAVTFYEDGVPIADTTGTAPITDDLTSPEPLLFAAFGGTTRNQSQFVGTMDEIEVFDRCLAPSEINSLFVAGSAGKCKPECNYTQDDDFEDNDTCFHAVPIQSFSNYSDLYAADIDPDWYSVLVPALNTLIIDVSFNHLAGDIDMELYSACNGAQIASSSGTFYDVQRITWTNLGASCTVYLKVFMAPRSAGCNRYSLFSQTKLRHILPR